MTEAPFDLELYWGPEDGILMELPKIKSPIGIDRPETVYINNSVYKIFKASEFPNLAPQNGVTHIGVYFDTA